MHNQAAWVLFITLQHRRGTIRTLLSQTRSTGITWELVRNADAQPQPRPAESESAFEDPGMTHRYICNGCGTRYLVPGSPSGLRHLFSQWLKMLSFSAKCFHQRELLHQGHAPLSKGSLYPMTGQCGSLGPFMLQYLEPLWRATSASDGVDDFYF